MEIEAVLKFAESLGWQVIQNKRGHAWGKLRCPLGTREGCNISIYSTPRNPDVHARYLQQCIRNGHCLDEQAE